MKITEWTYKVITSLILLAIVYEKMMSAKANLKFEIISDIAIVLILLGLGEVMIRSLIHWTMNKISKAQLILKSKITTPGAITE
ncbi:MAG: hypothetical protein HOP08_08225 [Cyclobacteriaceae bacterium]|nr:hypothetical protein [Cyclobacteriaceae bacterium]